MRISNRTNFINHAVIWDNRTWQDLTPGATFDNRATAVNNNGQVTGYYYSPVGHIRAFIWDKFKGLREIGTLGGATSCGYGINRKGRWWERPMLITEHHALSSGGKARGSRI